MPLGLRLSVGANLALLATAVMLWLRAEPGPPILQHAVIPVVEQRVDATKAAGVLTGAAHDAEGLRLSPETLARLEQSGISRHLLVDVWREDYRRKGNKRAAQLEARYAPNQPPQREYLALQRQQEDEQIRELKDLLGEEGYLAWDKEETLRKLNFEEVPMNPAEAGQAYRLQKQLDEKLRTLQMGMEDGDADIADMGTLQMQAQESFEKELEKLLGHERYNQLKGYTFPLVEGHMELNELSPSPEQVDALKGADSEYRTKEAALSRRLRDKPADAVAIAAELQALKDTREESFRKALGADAYVQFKLEHDTTYQTLKQYAGAWNLKESDIAPVYEKLRTFQDNVDGLRQAAQMSELAGESADWKTINSAIDQARQQTEASLQDLIGGEPLRRLTRNGLLTGADPNSAHPPPGS